MTRKTKKIINTWFWRVMVLIIAMLLVSISSNQFGIMVGQEQIKTMQTDTLDQLMLMQLDSEMDRLEPDYWEEWSKDVIEEPVEPISLSPEERALVCRVVAAEARGEDLQGMMAVAQTILDRSELWNMTPAEVVQAPGQYADPYQGEISDEIHLAVANVFDGGVRVFEEPVTHFYSGSEPYWADGKVDRGGIGCHRFLY